MNGSNFLVKQPKMALVAAAVAVVLASSAGAQQRENANRPTQQSTQIARADTGMQSLEQHLESATLRASKLVGMELQNRSGDNLGEVNDILRGGAPGQEMQLVVALGGVVGDDQKLVAIPFDDIQITAKGDELYTTRTREQLAGLPAIALEPSQIDDAAAANRNAGNDGRPAATRGAASLSQRRIGDLVGAEVVGSGGESVGEIDDIVLSMAGADSVRAVLQVGGIAGVGEKRVSLPLNDLTIEREGTSNEPTVRVAMDGDSLERLPEFEYERETAAL